MLKCQREEAGQRKEVERNLENDILRLYFLGGKKTKKEFRNSEECLVGVCEELSRGGR